MTGHRYRDEILAPVVVPFFNANRNVTLFQQDNARCHTARVSMRYQDEQHVKVLLWPTFSPDLSPIRTLFGPYADEAPLSLTQTKGTHDMNDM